MEKLIDALVDVVSDRVLEKLLVNEKMKNFLKLNGKDELNAEDIDDFDEAVANVVEKFMQNASWSTEYQG
jgi:hypothetical protein